MAAKQKNKVTKTKDSDDADVDALLDVAVATDTKKKKSDVPVININDAKTASDIKKFIKAYKAKATIEATIKDLQNDLIPAAKKSHQEALKEGAATPTTTTIKLQTKDGKALTIDVAKNQYSNIPVDAESELKEIFEDEYKSLFKKEMSISLSKEALKDKNILKKLILAVGKENLNKYFNISHFIKPTDKFHQERFTEGEIKDMAEHAIDEGIVKPYKLAIRV